MYHTITYAKTQTHKHTNTQSYLDRRKRMCIHSCDSSLSRGRGRVEGRKPDAQSLGGADHSDIGRAGGERVGKV